MILGRLGSLLVHAFGHEWGLRPDAEWKPGYATAHQWYAVHYLTPAGRLRYDQVWPAHADGIGRYFAQPLAPRDIGELARILDSLIQANQNHDQPG